MMFVSHLTFLAYFAIAGTIIVSLCAVLARQRRLIAELRAQQDEFAPKLDARSVSYEMMELRASLAQQSASIRELTSRVRDLDRPRQGPFSEVS